MFIFVAVIHVLVCAILILVVLLQSGKGGMGAAFGGASQTVFGARGATSFLGKMTAISAGVFMLTSLTLAYLSTSRDESLKRAAEQQEERAKARSLPKRSKRTKVKAGAMSGVDAGAPGDVAPEGDTPEEAPGEAPSEEEPTPQGESDAGADEGQ